MIELLARLFIRNSRHTDDPRVRTAYGMLCSAVAITLNILLAAAKFVVGTLAGSVSITADAMNNLSDVGSDGRAAAARSRSSASACRGKSPISSIRSATGGSSM